ncbi:tumor protein D54 isoform X1 [Patella vulgata]|uniref:tumor protein D54 isoform X1 n=1 Tax=Patella vulgata TaxID=6465 RepID=UPI002180061C|nr:tumor protein D54 isoform X1 [Patella vulgata]XP_050392533.1 tumor protein D54 isoform X1 [Patella vulgata]XP_050392541.1 tumor protein D54 isoform X1 [Patella vulgata]XP_050392549.1 tumor protein D54 isoform X1 [Patella vulgata]
MRGDELLKKSKTMDKENNVISTNPGTILMDVNLQGLSVTDATDEDKDYDKVINSLADYHNYLSITQTTSLSDDENSLSEKSFEDDQVYDNLTSPVFETAQSVDEDTPVYQDPVERDRQMLEWKEELIKVEGEIATLRQVLGTKVRYASELKRKMGITPFQEFKADMATSLEHIKGSEGYQKTNAKITEINDKITHSTAYQKTTGIVRQASEKTTSAFSAVGATVSKKLGDIKNSPTFKSLEEKVEHTYTNVKSSRSIENLKEKLAKVTGSKSTNGLNEELREEPESDSASLVTSPSGPLPEEKVPLN